MDARKYLGMFQDVSTPKEVYLPDNVVGEVAFSESELLSGTLKHLYVSRDVQFLGDPVPPAVVLEAQEHFDDFKDLRVLRGAVGDVRRDFIKKQPGHKTDQMSFLKDGSIGRGREEILDEVMLSMEKQHLDLADVATATFNDSIVAVSRKLRKHEMDDPKIGEPYKDQVAKTVVQTLQQHRAQIANEFLDHSGAMDLTRHTIDGVNVGGVKVEQVANRGSGQRWHENTQEWDEVIYTTLAKIFEFDCYAALYEWVIDRKLPLVPIIAPIQIESGVKAPGVDKNPRADILLCSLADENIIPVQVKMSPSVRKYEDGVRIITPDRLGLVDYETVPVRGPDGRVHTGRRATTHVGSLRHSFGVTYNSISKGHRVRHPEYAPRLAKAFAAFDVYFAADIAAYKKR